MRASHLDQVLRRIFVRTVRGPHEVRVERGRPVLPSWSHSVVLVHIGWIDWPACWT